MAKTKLNENEEDRPDNDIPVAKAEEPVKEEPKEESTDISEKKSVVKTPAIVQKKSLGRKIKEMLFGDDAKDVGSYLLSDVFLPAAKNLLYDAVSQGANRLIFGNSSDRVRNNNRFSGYNSNYRNYNDRYSSRESSKRTMSYRARAHHDFDDIVFNDRGDAQATLDQMMEIIDRYEVCRVSDFYEAAEITTNYTDDNWGWYSLRGSRILQTRNGFILDLPEPEPISNRD